jgi:hypothetical protein
VSSSNSYLQTTEVSISITVLGGAYIVLDFPNLESVGPLTFLVQGGTLTRISLPKLKTATAITFTFLSTGSLEELSMPALANCTSISFDVQSGSSHAQTKNWNIGGSAPSLTIATFFKMEMKTNSLFGSSLLLPTLASAESVALTVHTGILGKSGSVVLGGSSVANRCALRVANAAANAAACALPGSAGL